MRAMKVGRGLALTACGLVAITANAQCLRVNAGPHIDPHDGAPSDNFGRAVAVNGNTMAIGAPEHPVGDFVHSGMVYVYERSEAGWELRAQLTAFDAGPSDAFGVSVAIDSDTLIVGAYRDDVPGNGLFAGSAYVYVRTPNGWEFQAKLIASDGAYADGFGISVAIEGNHAVIGSYGDDVTRPDSPNPYFLAWNAGSAYVFERLILQDGTPAWWQRAKLSNPSPQRDEQFGVCVAIDQDRIAVGAPEDDEGSIQNTGSVYLYDLVGEVWLEQARLVASDASQGDWLGSAVDLEGDVLVAGAKLEDNEDGLQTGAAYVFERLDSGWAQTAKLIAADPTILFGSSVALEGGLVAVGALWHHSAEVEQGALYLYSRAAGGEGAWRQRLMVNGVASDGGLGASASLDKGVLVIGAPQSRTAMGVLSGGAYVYETTLAGIGLADVDADGDVDSTDFFAFVDAFLSGRMEADLDASGDINSSDFMAFVAAFLDGC